MKKVLCLIVALSALVLFSCSAFKGDDSRFVRGKTENNVYTSEFAEIRFAPGPSWKFANENEMLEKNGIDSSLAADEDGINNALSELDTIYDMEAEDNISGVGVSIAFVNISENIGTENMTEDEYIDRLKRELEPSFEGLEHSFSTQYSETFGEKEYKAVDADFHVGDSEYVQSYFIRKSKGYMVSVCVSALKTTDISDVVLSFFSAAR